MRFLTFYTVSIATLGATLANAACRDTEIFLLDAIVRGMYSLTGVSFFFFSEHHANPGVPAKTRMLM